MALFVLEYQVSPNFLWGELSDKFKLHSLLFFDSIHLDIVCSLMGYPAGFQLQAQCIGSTTTDQYCSINKTKQSYPWPLFQILCSIKTFLDWTLVLLSSGFLRPGTGVRRAQRSESLNKISLILVFSLELVSQGGAILAKNVFSTNG